MDAKGLLPPGLTEQALREIANRLDVADRLDDLMREYFDQIIEMAAQEHCLSPEQIEELEERMAWDLTLLETKSA